LTSSGARSALPLLIAAAGAVIVLLGFFSTLAQLGAVVAIVAGTALSMPSRGAPEALEATGVRWWRLLAGGALTSVVALPLSLALETIGGLPAGIGAALVIVAVVFGYPR
jgi:hypothetical protein